MILINTKFSCMYTLSKLEGVYVRKLWKLFEIMGV